jgi:hypothetical protein
VITVNAASYRYQSANGGKTWKKKVYFDGGPRLR